MVVTPAGDPPGDTCHHNKSSTKQGPSARRRRKDPPRSDPRSRRGVALGCHRTICSARLPRSVPAPKPDNGGSAPILGVIGRPQLQGFWSSTFSEIAEQGDLKQPPSADAAHYLPRERWACAHPSAARLRAACARRAPVRRTRSTAPARAHPGVACRPRSRSRVPRASRRPNPPPPRARAAPRQGAARRSLRIPCMREARAAHASRTRERPRHRMRPSSRQCSL